MDLRPYFAAFLAEISIGPPQTDRMDSAVRAITDFLMDRYGLPEGHFFLQGSYPNGTAVEPPDGGEYDVDLVAICVPAQVTADAALGTLEGHFLSDGRYAKRLKRKKPCVRLEYASDDVGEFHVDVVPVRVASGQPWPLDAPRRGDGWHGTAPREYTKWCQDQGVDFADTVRSLKRWRDTQQSVRAAIKSIVLQVLVSQHMPTGHMPQAERLAATVRSMHNWAAVQDSVPTITNPVLPTENLAARWSLSDFKNFVVELDEAWQWVDIADAATDLVEACDAWREILGEAFPLPGAANLGLLLADTTHRRTVDSMSWVVQHDPAYSVAVDAYVQRGRRGQNRHRYVANGTPVFAGNKLNFIARVRAPRHVEVWWQVVNTGQHARHRGSLRGDYLQSRQLNMKPSRDPNDHWESAEFTGVHLVKALLVRDNVVVAESSDLPINIYNKTWRFGY